MYKQVRFKVLRQTDPERAEVLLGSLRKDVISRWKFYEQMANLEVPRANDFGSRCETAQGAHVHVPPFVFQTGTG